MKILFPPIRILTITALFFLMSCIGFAQTDKNDWNNLQKLTSGTTLKIKLKSGEKLEGKLSAVTADSISLSLNNRTSATREFPKAEIAEVRRKSNTRTAAFAGALAAGGFFLGAAAGYGIGEVSDADGAIPDYVGALVGVGVGAVCGALIGNRGVLVYKAP